MVNNISYQNISISINSSLFQRLIFLFLFTLAIFFVAVNSESTDEKPLCPAGTLDAKADCECAPGARVRDNKCVCYNGNTEPYENKYCPVN